MGGSAWSSVSRVSDSGRPCVFGNGGVCLVVVVGVVGMSVVSLVLFCEQLCVVCLATSRYILVPVSLYSFLRPRWKPALFT